MPHMVVFRTKEGKPGYHWADSLDDAVRFVEHLRNNEQIDDSKVYRMSEVPIEFKVLYKVEVAGEGSSADAAGSDSPAARRPAEGTSRPDGPGPVRAGSMPSGEGQTSSASAQPSNSSGSGPGGTAPADGSPVAQAGGRFGLFSQA